MGRQMAGRQNVRRKHIEFAELSIWQLDAISPNVLFPDAELGEDGTQHLIHIDPSRQAP